MIKQDFLSFNQIAYQAAYDYGVDFILTEQKELRAKVMCSVNTTEWIIANNIDAAEALLEIKACNKSIIDQYAEVDACTEAAERVVQEGHEQNEPVDLLEGYVASIIDGRLCGYDGLSGTTVLNDEKPDGYELI